MKIQLFLALILLVSVSLFSCKPNIEKPVINYNGFEVKEFKLDHVSLDLKLEIYNPNNIDIHQTKLNYELLIDGILLSEGNDIPLKLLAEKKTDISLPVILYYKEFLKTSKSLIAAFITGKESLPFVLNTEFEFDFLMIKIKIPKKITSEIKL